MADRERLAITAPGDPEKNPYADIVLTEVYEVLESEADPDVPRLTPVATFRDVGVATAYVRAVNRTRARQENSPDA